MSLLTEEKIKEIEKQEYENHGRVLLYEKLPDIDKSYGKCRYCKEECCKQCISNKLLVYIYPNGNIKEEKIDKWWLG